MKKALLTLSVLAGSVTAAFAQAPVINGGPLLGLLGLAQEIVSRLIPFAVSLAVVAFFWFLVTFIWKGRSSPDEQQKSLKGMGYSVLALFVMVSIWGIVGFMASLTGIGQGGSIPVPSVPRPAPGTQQQQTQPGTTGSLQINF